MEYIVHKRFKRKALCGEVNLPALTLCEETDGMIRYHGKDICYCKSNNAHQYFARNDDGNGMLRGNLTQSIEKTLGTPDDQYETRWNAVWRDAICKSYKRIEFADSWYWSHEFYNADISDLQHIARLIHVKENH